MNEQHWEGEIGGSGFGRNKDCEGSQEQGGERRRVSGGVVEAERGGGKGLFIGARNEELGRHWWW
jgi:hypothetical protein